MFIIQKYWELAFRSRCNFKNGLSFWTFIPPGSDPIRDLPVRAKTGPTGLDWLGLAWTGLDRRFQSSPSLLQRSASQSSPMETEGLSSPGQSSPKATSVQSMDWTGPKMPWNFLCECCWDIICETGSDRL